MKKNLFTTSVLSALALAGFALPASAGSPDRDVYPKPQKVFVLRSVPVPAAELSPQAAEQFPALAEALRSRGIVPAGRMSVSAKIDPNDESVRRVPGAYALAVSLDDVKITAFDEAGVFYAIQTLAQMIEADGKIQPCVVEDFPDVPFRGSVEGFYGKPWEHERRLSQIRFYGKHKMNAYVYGPKDDPYSGFNSELWRAPYPPEKAKKISELAAAARENHVAFFWAMHPGATIRWDDADGDGVPDDFAAALKKMEAMYALGVRAYAVFPDDVSGEGTKAEKQAEMMNFLNREFVRRKKDVAPLLLCPTDYAGTRESNYRKIIGEKLDDDIRVMWTGPRVCADIPAPDVKTVSAHWRRAPFIWWNWPVSDYCRTRLLLGRTYGLDKENKGRISGFVSNPMDKPEASKIALFGVADWTWNIDAFDSEKNWAAAFPHLYPQPEVAEAMAVFARHNSDQGEGSDYRREESADFKPVASGAIAEYQTTGTLGEANRRRLEQEFSAVSESAATLEKTLPQSDPALWHEIEYWVKSFAELGELGSIALETATQPDMSDAARAAAFSRAVAAKSRQLAYFEAQKKRHFEETEPSDKKSATGCRVGMRVLTPLVDEIIAGEWKKFCESFGETAAAKPECAYKAFTNVPELGAVSAHRRGIYVHLHRILETVKLAPGQFIGLALPEGVPATYIHVKLDNPQAAQACVVEASVDGKKWLRANTLVSGGEIQCRVEPKTNIRFFRLINVSDAPAEFRINLFKFDVPADAKANSREALFDGDLASSFLITEPMTFDEPKGKTLYVISDAEKIERGNGTCTVPASPERPVRIHEVFLK